MASAVPDGARRRFYARADAATKTGEIWIYDLIGETMWGCGVMAKDVAAAIKQCEAEGAKSLSIFINSDGGEVFEGVSIHSVLSRFAGQKTVYIDGKAASIASLIAMAGDKICISPAAMMMIHDPSAGAMGRSKDLRRKADFIDQIRDSMIEAYSSRTGKDAATIKAMMEAETWMKAPLCVSLGFADEIVQTIAPSESALAEMAIAAAAPSSILASYQNLPADLKQKLFAQHPHLSQSPQSRAPDRVSPKPRASGKDHRHMDTDINEITASHERTVKAQASAHEAETKSFTTRLNIALAERDTAHTQLSSVQAKVATAEGTIKSHEATIGAYKQDAEQIFALTGKTTLAEARGVIAAFKAEAGEVSNLRAQAAAQKEATTKATFMALLDKGVAAGKITPIEFEQMKATPVAGMDTATAFVETYFMKRDPVVKMQETKQPKPEETPVLTGMSAEEIQMLKDAGMDPAAVLASTKAGNTPPVS